jgi:hypothetical protein
MQPDKHQKNVRDFDRVVIFSVALSLGAMACFLYSVKQINPTIQLEFTAGSILAFALAAIAGGLFARLALSEAAQETTGPSRPGAWRSRRRIWLVVLGVLLFLGLVLSFLHSLKDVSVEKRSEFVAGTLMAFLALLVVGLVCWRIIRFLEQEEKNPGAGQQPPESE